MFTFASAYICTSPCWLLCGFDHQFALRNETKLIFFFAFFLLSSPQKFNANGFKLYVRFFSEGLRLWDPSSICAMKRARIYFSMISLFFAFTSQLNAKNYKFYPRSFSMHFFRLPLAEGLRLRVRSRSSDHEHTLPGPHRLVLPERLSSAIWLGSVWGEEFQSCVVGA